MLDLGNRLGDRHRDIRLLHRLLLPTAPPLSALATGLRRLSPRTVVGPSTASVSASPQRGLHSFALLAAAVLAHLRASGVAVLPGLTELELAHVEAELGFAL